MSNESTEQARRPLPPWILWTAVCAFFAALSLAWLWPLPRSMGGHVVRAPYWWDAELNAYLLAEARHNLRHVLERPSGLFDARILHPQGEVLALSENQLTPALLTLPFDAVASPIALHNLLVILGVAGTGIATFAYLRRRVRDSAALVGALLFALAPIHLCLLARVQLTATWLLPLLLLTLERTLERPGARRAAVFGGVWLAQLTTCVYYAVHFAVLAAPVALWMVARSWRLGARRWLATGAVMAAVGCASAALVLPYARSARELGMTRDAAFVAGTSGIWSDLLRTSDLSATWGRFASPVDQDSAREPVAFPGALLLALAVAGIFFLLVGRRRSAKPAAPMNGAALFGPEVHLLWVGLSLLLFLGTGPDAPRAPFAPFGWLQALPGFQGMRYASRFAVFGTLALSVVASFGVEALLERARERGRAVALGSVALLAAGGIGEGWTRSLPLQPAPAPEPVYRLLREDPGAHALVEIPFDGWLHPPRVRRNLGASVHGLPTLGGYTGFDPPVWRYVQDQLLGWPDGDSHTLLVALGVDRLLVHEHESTGRAAPLGAVPWLRRLASDEEHTVYAVTGVEPDRAGALREAPRARPVRSPPAKAIAPARLRIVPGPGLPADTSAMLDGDPATRWTTGRSRRPGTWFTVELAAPATVSALWLDTRAAPLDGPSSISIVGVREDGSRVGLLAEPPHACVERLRHAPAAGLSVLRFPATRVRALEVSEQGSSSRHWGAVYGLWVEAAGH